MSKKMMLLALSAVSAALFALPAVASATPAHISAPEGFNILKGALNETVELETTGGEKLQCHGGVSGSGKFENTTTGTLNLKLHWCTASTIFGNLTCTTAGQPSGTWATTTLPFHLVKLAAHSSGALITTGAGGHFATFVCGGIAERKVTGNGAIGTITSPTCGTASTTATLQLVQGGNTGVQKDTTYTGVTYGLQSTGTPMALNAEGRIQFGSAKTINCT